MERLTQTSNSGGVAFTFDLDITCQPSEARKILKLAEKLKTYEDAEEQGLLLRFPCGIGSDVYMIPSKINYKLNILSLHPENNRVYHQKVDLITFTENGWYIKCDKDREYAIERILSEKMYKETWFLSQAEAEAKLAEMEGAE